MKKILTAILVLWAVAAQATFNTFITGQTLTASELNGAFQTVLYGNLTITVTTSDVTLTDAEALYPVIIVTGAMTGNHNLIFPTGDRSSWTVYNQTTGGYQLILKTAAGAGVSTVGGYHSRVFTDGTNIYYASAGSGNNYDITSLNGANSIGFNTAPSAWGTSLYALDIGTSTGLANEYSTNITDLVNNAYWNGSSWVYKNTGTAGLLQELSNATLQYSTTASGTGGAGLAWTNTPFKVDTNGNETITGSLTVPAAAGIIDPSGSKILSASPANAWYVENSTDTQVPLTVFGHSVTQSADLFDVYQNGGGQLYFNVANSGAVNVAGSLTLMNSGASFLTHNGNSIQSDIAPFGWVVSSISDTVTPMAYYGHSATQSADLFRLYNYGGGTEELSVSASGALALNGGITLGNSSGLFSAAGSGLQFSGSGSGLTATSASDIGIPFITYGHSATQSSDLLRLYNYNGGSEKFGVDVSGNIYSAGKQTGLGAPAWGWNSENAALDVGSISAIADFGSGLYAAYNLYFNGTNWIYKTSGYGAYINTDNLGNINFATVPSGTAAAAVSPSVKLSIANDGTLTSNKGCSSGYSRVSPNHCLNTAAAAGGWTNESMGARQILLAPAASNAKFIDVAIWLQAKAINATSTSPRTVTAQFYTASSGGTQIGPTYQADGMETVATVSGTILGDSTTIVTVPVNGSGQVWILGNYLNGNMSAVGTSIVGYRD
ncbi:hypothetical protein KGP36_06745 [Patescibacteria group bacterium]|nr:hypothetical protein [Patescibacteria group bacterium]